MSKLAGLLKTEHIIDPSVCDDPEVFECILNTWSELGEFHMPLQKKNLYFRVHDFCDKFITTWENLKLPLNTDFEIAKRVARRKLITKIKRTKVKIQTCEKTIQELKPIRDLHESITRSDLDKVIVDVIDALKAENYEFEYDSDDEFDDFSEIGLVLEKIINFCAASRTRETSWSEERRQAERAKLRLKHINVDIELLSQVLKENLLDKEEDLLVASSALRFLKTDLEDLEDRLEELD